MKERGTVSQTVLGFALSGTGLSVNQLSLCVRDLQIHFSLLT